MWKVKNSKNKDMMRFDDAETAMAVFEVMKRNGYSVFIIAPDGTIVNYA